MTDGAKILAEATGLSKAEIHELFDEVKANRAKLSSCKVHKFEGGPIKSLGAKYICQHCGGIETLTRISDYIDGYRAAGGAPEDIWPGWK